MEDELQNVNSICTEGPEETENDAMAAAIAAKIAQSSTSKSLESENSSFEESKNITDVASMSDLKKKLLDTNQLGEKLMNF